MTRASPLILRSWLYSKIEHKTAESDTSWGSGPGEYFFFNPQHSHSTPHKRATNWKAVESYWSESYSTFYSCTQKPHVTAQWLLWSLQSSCSSLCILWHWWRRARDTSHVAWRLSCPRPSVSLAILASLPRSLLSLSPSDEALAVSVINLPPDINLFQLLRVRPGLNKHTGHNPVSGITCPLSPPPGTGQPTERIIIYD